jgi:hypothetical protein
MESIVLILVAMVLSEIESAAMKSIIMDYELCVMNGIYPTYVIYI